MTLVSFRVDEQVLRRADEWSRRTGVDRSALLRDALRRHLDRLAAEDDADRWVAQPLDGSEVVLTDVADWGPNEDWADWSDATG